MTTRITSANIAPGAITADRLAEGVGGGPKISNIQVTDNTYTVLDDTAVGLSGGYVKITGTGFQTGCVAIIGSTTATATAFVSGNFINVQVPALAAGTYIVYVVNPDGGVAIRVNGLTYSQIPLWITGSTLPEIGVDDQISIQLSAAGDSPVEYSLLAEFTLPPGLSLSAQGLLTGSVTGLENDTVYSFTVIARDTENQDSPRTFSITVGVGDPYFYLTTLLLNGDGTNAAQNNTFLDSSTNNFTVTRSGNTTQGSFSPFSQPDGRWSAYFDGTGDGLNAGSQSAYAFGTGPFCIEFWVYNTALKNYSCGVTTRPDNGSYADAYHIGWDSVGGVSLYINTTSSPGGAAGTMKVGQWQHFVCCRDGSNATSIFVDGTRVGTATITANFTRQLLGIGDFPTTPAESVQGYLSNVRLVKGSSVYDPTQTTITVPTSPLTAISGTSILTCQSNRFRDNSSNNFAITVNGDVSVQPVSPFKATAKYLPAVNGGSGYFDGTGDYLSLASNDAFNMGTGDFTLECYYYHVSGSSALYPSIFSSTDWSGGGVGLRFNNTGQTNKFAFFWNGVGDPWLSSSSTYPPFQWNHVALTRSGNTFTLWVNGQSAATNTNSGSINFNYNGGGPRVGWGPWDGNNGYLKGIISSMRVVKGTALYTSAFTPPAELPTAVSGTSLLLNYNNAAIFDATGRNNLETVGNAQISTGVTKYGTGSMYFDGSTSNLVVPYSPNYSLGTGNFTIEGWFYFTNLGTDLRGLVALGDGANGTGPVYNAWSLQYRGSEGSNQIAFSRYDGTVYTYETSGVTLVANTWTHIAACRSGGVLRIFVNGISYYSAANTQNFGTINTNPLRVALQYYGPAAAYGGPRYWPGYIDDLRITRGFARYTANFTPPASAHRLR